MQRRLFLVLSWIAIAFVPAAFCEEKAHDFAKWEKAVAAFEQADKANPPPQNAILFIGSSTIVRWSTLAQDFPEHQVINRGFGGNQIIDSTHFAERMIFPYKPRQIFLRAGGNDLNSGKSPERVFEEFKDFVAKVQGKLPETEIVFISVAHTPLRWKLAEKEKAFNALVKDYIGQQSRLKYVETGDMAIGADGMPREELFVADKLHINADGYKILAERVRPFLTKLAK
jgi:lysophospholipase L1-like esterase